MPRSGRAAAPWAGWSWRSGYGSRPPTASPAIRLPAGSSSSWIGRPLGLVGPLGFVGPVDSSGGATGGGTAGGILGDDRRGRGAGRGLAYDPVGSHRDGRGRVGRRTGA